MSFCKGYVFSVFYILNHNACTISLNNLLNNRRTISHLVPKIKPVS